MNDDTDVRPAVRAGEDGEDDVTDVVRTGAPRTARACPACGVFNPRPREVCRTCGVDLETGEALPWPEPDPDPDLQSAPAVPAPHPRRWWLAVAAILAVAGLVLLGLVVAEVGPFAPPPEIPSAVFDAETYDGEPTGLMLSDVATISTHPPIDGRPFEAAQMVDNDPETAWRSDGLQADDTVDQPLEIIDLFLDEPAWISSIVLRNGDQAGVGAYQEAARLRRVRAVVDGGEVYLLNLLDDGRGQQAVELPEPVLTSMLRLEIVAVFPGTAEDGVAISDLELRGWTAVGQDVALADDRAEVAPATAPPPPA